MTLNRRTLTYVLTSALALWIYFLFFVPTFDFDESLYRRVADAMKVSGNPWQLTWDGDALYHKPPLFYWLVCFWSTLVDGIHAPVSSLAARLPSFFSTLGILTSLFFGIEYIQGKKLNFETKMTPVLLFMISAFPLFTGTGVVFDPLQTLLLMPALLVSTRFFYRNEKMKIQEWAALSFSLFLSSASKGLNGIIVPSFAFALQLLLQFRQNGLAQLIKKSFSYLWKAFLPAALLTAFYYYLLDQKIGPKFTEEFIWVQHFGRSAHAMEAHGGSIFYHPLVIFLGAGFLSPFFFYSLKNYVIDWKRFSFPLTYVFSFVFIFSFSATKLPHYTWPVWPALALFLTLLVSGTAASSENSGNTLDRRLGFLASLPVFFFSILCLLLASNPQELLLNQDLGPMAESLIRHFSGFSYFERTLLYSSAVLGMIFQIKRASLTRSLVNTCAFAISFYLCFAFGALRPIRELLVEPYFVIAKNLKDLNPKPNECIRHTGALSPTLSIALGNELSHNRCEPNTMRYLIVSEWKLKECQEQKMDIVAQYSYLYLCVKH